MTLTELIQRVKDLVAQARAATTFSDYVALAIAASLLITEIVKLVSTSPSPPRMMASPNKAAAFASAEVKSEDDLLDDLEAHCAQASGSTGMAAAPQGPFIDAILPILLALLKKWLLG